MSVAPLHGAASQSERRASFEDSLTFALDEVQIEAFDSLDAGASVLVSAPTGSGKTLVAAYGVHRALSAQKKAFYTTPLKALSNQKYVELVAEQLIGRAGGGAKAAVHALAQDGLGRLAVAGAFELGGERGLHGSVRGMSV